MSLIIMSESGNSCDFSLEGHHEDFENSELYEMKYLRKEVEMLKSDVQRLTWHCLMYRKTLMKIPFGHLKLHEEMEACKQDDHSLCLECERDFFLERIKHLEEKLNQATTFEDLGTEKKQTLLQDRTTSTETPRK